MGARNLKHILKESFWMAIDAIRQNKLRSILTLLGISIGVFSVIGVMTAIRTLESSVQSGLNVFATNTFILRLNSDTADIKNIATEKILTMPNTKDLRIKQSCLF